MKTNSLINKTIMFYIVIQFITNFTNQKKNIKKSHSLNKISNSDDIVNSNLNDNSIDNFIFEKRTVNNEKSNKMTCSVNSDCKDCQMSGFQIRCHDKMCYCCGSDKKCYCQK